MAKVLVVEDNELNIKLFSDLLTIKHHEVLISRDGRDVMSIVQSERPDIVLMDIQLNEISGIDLIKELKSTSLTSSIPIIAITAMAMRDEVAKIIESGCDLYLAKPVFIDQFFDALYKFVKPAVPA